MCLAKDNNLLKASAPKWSALKILTNENFR